MSRLIAAFLALTVWVPALAAAIASEEHLANGIQLLERRAYAEALARFEAAGRAAPADPDTYFYAGAAANRLGQADRALTALDRALYLYGARSIEAPHPDLDFERGWALLALGRYADARTALSRYETGHPGRAQTAEFLGRTAVAEGDDAAAEAHFAEALRRDPDLATTIELARAAQAEKQGNLAEAERALASALGQPRATRLSRLLAEQVAAVTAPPTASQGVSIALAAGHNSNAVGLSDDQPVAATAAEQSDNLYRYLLNAFHIWRPGDAWSLTASYALQADFYADTANVDQLDNVASLQAVRAFGPRLSAGLELRDRYTRIDGDGLLNDISLTPTAWWRWNERVLFELEYSYTDGDFLVRPASRALDRDHVTHTLAPGLHFALPALRSALRASYAHRWVSAVGSDFDAAADGSTAQLDTEWPWRVTSRVYLSYEHRDFEHPNSLSAPPLARDDDFYYLSVFVQRPLGDLPGVSEKLRAFAQYDYADRNSNIAFYGYHQHVVTAGVMFAF